MRDGPDRLKFPLLSESERDVSRKRSPPRKEARIMKVPAVLLVGLLASPAFIAEEKSGCQPGEGVPTFNVIDVTGKYSPNAVCYI